MLLLIPDDEVTSEIMNGDCHIAGGLPYFYSDDVIIPTCAQCLSNVSLLVQVYAPSHQSHRSLYVFYCSASTCTSDDIIAKSYCCIDQVQEPCNSATDCQVRNQQSTVVKKDSWGLDDSDDDIDIELECLMQTKLRQADCRPAIIRIEGSRESSIRGFYLAEIDEPDKYNDQFRYELDLLKQYELDQEISINQDSFQDETYEQSGDVTFMKFHKRLSRDYRQCVRYGSDPLLMRKHESIHVPVCPECHHERIFEMQLMPNLINLLDLPHHWGTISIFTCSKYCTRNRLCDEFVFIEDGF